MTFPRRHFLSHPILRGTLQIPLPKEGQLMDDRLKFLSRGTRELSILPELFGLCRRGMLIHVSGHSTLELHHLLFHPCPEALK